MLYYKIPIIDGCFDYPAGCVLCCAYPVDSYMYCKFERVTSAGSDWVAITESEFNVRYPDFADAPPPTQEVIATSATLTDGSIELALPAPVDTGTLVKFSAPCSCESVTGGIVIDGDTYALVNAVGAAVASTDGLWAGGAQLAVLLDVSAKKAYIQNEAALRTSGGTMTGSLTVNGLILTEGVDYGDTLPETGVTGQLFFLAAEEE